MITVTTYVLWSKRLNFVFISTALFYCLPVICKLTRKDSHMLYICVATFSYF